MARHEPEPLVEALRIDAGVMREQLDELTALGPRIGNRPPHQLLSNAPAAAVHGDANVLDQAARGSLRAQSRHDAELEAADDGAVLILGDHEPNARTASNA